MSETRLRTSMPGVAAPTGAPRRPNYDVLIGQRASNREWWHPDPGYAIEGSTPGQLGTLLTQKASGGTALIQASAANQPLIIANVVRPVAETSDCVVQAAKGRLAVAR